MIMYHRCILRRLVVLVHQGLLVRFFHTWDIPTVRNQALWLNLPTDGAVGITFGHGNLPLTD